MTPRRNRVDPWGDLHSEPERGMFTGNRGCLLGDDGELRRHHRGSLWIICLTSYRGWNHPLDSPRVWTPLFFLDDAVALAAGHRPCGLCRRNDYLAYQRGVSQGRANGDGANRDGAVDRPVLAGELNRRLQVERLRRPQRGGARHSRGPHLERARDRIVWSAQADSLPTGVVVIGENGEPHLVTERSLRPFSFGGWGQAIARPTGGLMSVLTPPTSVAALSAGYQAQLHDSAMS
ncbi:MAG: hypothetical protein ACR2QO_03945 [Acidimicrobiales bacterium]